MDNQMVTRQLNIEIEKLKVGDYTSYQNFYSMTSNYLYTNVWNNVQDQKATYDIMNELYTDIYASIGTELTDNNQFFEWLDSKLFTHVTTYLTTHNMPCASERNGVNRTEQAAVIASGMNTAMGGGNASAGMGSAGGSGYAVMGSAGGSGYAGMGSATGGNGYAGVGSATGGNGYAGVGSATGGNGYAGVSSATGGNGSVGVESATGGNGSVGVSSATGGSGSVGLAPAAGGSAGIGSGAASVGAKVGISLGVKIAIGVISSLAVVGLGVGAVKILKPNAADTATTVEATTESVAQVTDESAADGTGDSTGVTEAATTEAATEEAKVDEATARYTAYYDFVKKEMEDYPVEATMGTGGFVYTNSFDGMVYTGLVDFNNTGNEQLILAYCENPEDGEEGTSKYTVKVFDFVDDEAKEIQSFDGYQFGYEESDAGKNLWVRSGTDVDVVNTEDYEDNMKMYTFNGDSFEEQQNYYIHYASSESGGMVGVVTAYDDNGSITGDEYNDKVGELEELPEFYKLSERFDYGFADNSRQVKALKAKHDTVDLLAEKAGDKEWAKTKDVVNLDDNTQGDDQQYTFTANKYNEVYSTYFIINRDLTEAENDYVQVSDDKKTIHVYGHIMRYKYQPELIDRCYTYIDDILVVVGTSTGGSYGPASYYWSDDMDNIAKLEYNDEKEVSKEEYDANVEKLMSR